MLLIAVALQVVSVPAKPRAVMTQQQLDSLSDRCGAPRKWLRRGKGEEIRFQPSRDGEFAKVDCVLKQLYASLVPMKQGFVGNAEYTEEF